jgi:glycosyltransferase involved in cell wall biosynthesis
MSPMLSPADRERAKSCRQAQRRVLESWIPLDLTVSGSVTRSRWGRQSHVARTRSLDVVFYTPFIGLMLSRGPSLPPGGAETQILMIAKGLVRRGLRVGIIVFGRPEDLPRAVDGVRIVPRPPFIKRRLIGKFIEMFVIWRVLWRTPSKVIVFRGVGLQLMLLGVFARVFGRRLVFSSANIVDFDCRLLLAKHRDARMYEIGVRLAHAIVVQTEEQIGMCRHAFGRSPALIKSLKPLAEPVASDPEAFLWVGRLVSYKRPLDYLELARSVPEARFWMVGVPPIEAKERRLAEVVVARASELPNLQLLAPRSQPEIEELMSRAVAAVNTAEFEGMPNVLLEAWTKGVPALVFSHDPGGVVSMYGLGEFAHGSKKLLAELARKQWILRDNPAERIAVARRCREYIEQNHAPEVVLDQWLEILGICTSESPQPALTEAAEPTCVG